MPQLELTGTEPSTWLEALPPHNSRVIQEILCTGESYERVAEIWLSRTGSEKTVPLGAVMVGQNFYQNIKVELSKLVCGDPAYENVRKAAKRAWQGQKTAVVTVIAVAISTKVGVAAVAIVPAIALLLAAASQVGVNAWCGGTTQAVVDADTTALQGPTPKKSKRKASSRKRHAS
jgi:hypothetical protein